MKRAVANIDNGYMPIVFYGLRNFYIRKEKRWMCMRNETAEHNIATG